MAGTPNRRPVARKPRPLSFTDTEAGTLVKSPRRKLAETIAQRHGLPSLPHMISMGVIPSGQIPLVVKGKSHNVYLFPDGEGSSSLHGAYMCVCPLVCAFVLQ